MATRRFSYDSSTSDDLTEEEVKQMNVMEKLEQQDLMFEKFVKFYTDVKDYCYENQPTLLDKCDFGSFADLLENKYVEKPKGGFYVPSPFNPTEPIEKTRKMLLLGRGGLRKNVTVDTETMEIMEEVVEEEKSEVNTNNMTMAERLQL